jgi:anti-anti-sigma regulatory factor
MLKISLVDSQRQRRMIVEGMLVPPWTDELANECEKAAADLQGRELVVDLRGLTAISPAGENVLLQLMRSKVKLQCGVYMKELLGQLARDTQRKRQESINRLNDADSEFKGNED